MVETCAAVTTAVLVSTCQSHAHRCHLCHGVDSDHLEHLHYMRQSVSASADANNGSHY